MHRFTVSAAAAAVLVLATFTLAPAASASHQCDWSATGALGVDVETCTDAQGRPHFVTLRDRTLGGVMLGHPLFASGHSGWYGGDGQYTSATVWTYSNTPTGRTWFVVWNECEDMTGDGHCDHTWAGVSVFARGIVWVQPYVHRAYYNDGWYFCPLMIAPVSHWGCYALPTPPVFGEGPPMVPTLP